MKDFEAFPLKNCVKTMWNFSMTNPFHNIMFSLNVTAFHIVGVLDSNKMCRS